MRRGVAWVALVALVALTACDGPDSADPPATSEPGDETADPVEEPGDLEGDPDQDATETDDDPALAGISEEPCPEAIDETLGCLRLGVLADRGDAWGARDSDRQVWAQRAFWDRVNEAGGVGGHEVHLEVREVGAEPEEQLEVAAALLGEVLAIALLPGDATTPELAELLAARDVPAAIPGWWSGWHEDRLRPTLLAAADHSRCLAATAGLDWYDHEVERPLTVLAVAHEGPGAVDLDAAGERWTDATGVGWLGVTETGTVEDDDDLQDAAVQAVVDQEPDVVLVATTPSATGELVRKAAARGFEGTFLGMMGSWHPELLDAPEQAQALLALYRHLGPFGMPDPDVDGHAALLAAHESDEVVTPAALSGWMAAYPMLAGLRTAAAEGDLSRPGVHAVLDGLEVDTEGMLPARSLTADASPTPTVVSAPDAAAPGALRPEAEVGAGAHLDDLDHPDDCLA
jgi:hypothetical protein